jgi:hypothetical protein
MSASWPCSRCTLENAASLASCGACGATRAEAGDEATDPDPASVPAVAVPGGAQPLQEEEEEESKESLLKDFSCCVCFDLLYAPCTRPCGHTACLTCFDAWFSGGSSGRRHTACPVCRAELAAHFTVDAFGVNVQMEKMVQRIFPAEHAERGCELDEQVKRLKQAHFDAPRTPPLRPTRRPDGAAAAAGRAGRLPRGGGGAPARGRRGVSLNLNAHIGAVTLSFAGLSFAVTTFTGDCVTRVITQRPFDRAWDLLVLTGRISAERPRPLAIPFVYATLAESALLSALGLRYIPGLHGVDTQPFVARYVHRLPLYSPSSSLCPH